jgi:elongator complex protein 6
MASKIPPLLEPYLALPSEASLILLTSVLGASTNWLLLRFLHSALAIPEDEDTKVVFVSFMRDLAFWKDVAKRLVNIFRAFLFLEALGFGVWVFWRNV